MRPANWLIQANFAFVSSLSTNPSCPGPEAAYRALGPGSKSVIPEKVPATYTFPAASTARSPNDWDPVATVAVQVVRPVGPNLRMSIPLADWVVAHRLTMAYTFPAASTPTPCP